jgi:hypothetical protein
MGLNDDTPLRTRGDGEDHPVPQQPVRCGVRAGGWSSYVYIADVGTLAGFNPDAV